MQHIQAQRIDEVVAAYIGLIDIYGELIDDTHSADKDYAELNLIATEILLSSIQKVATDKKIDFCLKASAWLGIQQLSFFSDLVNRATNQPTNGVRELHSAFMRALL